MKLKNISGRGQGYGSCFRCADTWNWKAHHTTTYSNGEGCFPLCEECWQRLSPEERVPFYRELVALWAMDDPEAIEKWTSIKEAVLAGK